MFCHCVSTCIIKRSKNKDRKAYVVNGHQGAVRPADFTISILETLKGLGGCDFVDKVSVNVDQESAIFLLVDNVVVQDLVIQGLGLPIDAGHEGRSMNNEALVYGGEIWGERRRRWRKPRYGKGQWSSDRMIMSLKPWTTGEKVGWF